MKEEISTSALFAPRVLIKKADQKVHILKMKRRFKCKGVTYLSLDFVLSMIVYVIMKLIFYTSKTRKKTIRLFYHIGKISKIC